MSKRKPYKRLRRCHYCKKLTTEGRFQPFTDGKHHFVCDTCEERQDIDAAQERDESNDWEERQ